MSFLVEVLVFLCAAIVVVPICKRLGLSAVLGYLGAGLLIGPPGLGIISDAAETLKFAELGIVLLLFIIGLELHPKRLWVMRQLVFGLGLAQVLLSTAVIGGILLLLGLPPAAATLLGFSLALSSTAFVLQLLGEQKKLSTHHGRAAFGTLLLQDLAVIPAIAALNLLDTAKTGSGLDPVLVALVVAGAVAARFLLRPLLRVIAATDIHELFTAAALALVAGAALAMDSAGLSMGLGAFVAADYIHWKITGVADGYQQLVARIHALEQDFEGTIAVLRTQVELARQEQNLFLQDQNTKLLASVDQTTKSQAILQHTVEGLSIIVIAYYLSGLAHYLFKALHDLGWLANETLASGVFVPIALLLSFGLITWGKKRIHQQHSSSHDPPNPDTPNPQ